MRWAALALAALALTGCETTAEKSARLERAAKQHESEVQRRAALAQRALTITRQSTKVEVAATAIVRGSEGSAAVLTLRNSSATTLRDVPIAIVVRDAHGTPIYRNSVAGQAAALVSATLVPAHSEVTWIDDQIPASGAPAKVDAEVGEGEPAGGTIPRLSIAGEHRFEDPSSGLGVEGSVVNHSAASQQEVVVYAVARRAGRIVAAGRAVLPQVPAGTGTRFQLFFLGDPNGAQLKLSVLATTAG